MALKRVNHQQLGKLYYDELIEGRLKYGFDENQNLMHTNGNKMYRVSSCSLLPLPLRERSEETTLSRIIKSFESRGALGKPGQSSTAGW